MRTAVEGGGAAVTDVAVVGGGRTGMDYGYGDWIIVVIANEIS